MSHGRSAPPQGLRQSLSVYEQKSLTISLRLSVARISKGEREAEGVAGRAGRIHRIRVARAWSTRTGCGLRSASVGLRIVWNVVVLFCLWSFLGSCTLVRVHHRSTSYHCVVVIMCLWRSDEWSMQCYGQSDSVCCIKDGRRQLTSSSSKMNNSAHVVCVQWSWVDA